MEYETKKLTVTDLDVAAELIQQGECVAFPTETVYGLGANALNEKAVAKIFAAKGRPVDNPLIVHIHNQAQLDDLVLEPDEDIYALIAAFWPGPLTLVLRKTDQIPAIVTGGLDTVAVRIPDHPLALEFLKAASLPVAAPSANISGKPSPTRFSHVWHDLEGRVPAIIDGGETGWGVESTVLDCTCRPFRLLRPGAVTVEQIAAYVPVEMDPAINQEVQDSPRSPGMKYKHYSPEARVILVVGENIHQTIRQQVELYREQGLRVAVMAFSESSGYYGDVHILDLGSKSNLQDATSRIYHLLRKADHLDYQIVLVEGLAAENLGMTIMNRMAKAAGPDILHT